MNAAPDKHPSAIDALGEAFSHMRAKLFPFNFLGWITLGFVGLIESCGSGSGTGGAERTFPREAGGSFEDPFSFLQSALGWIAAHMLLVVGILMVIMMISLVFMWLRSRMIFVYIDDVASGRFDIVRPWNQHGTLADSWFVMSLVVQGASFILMILILAAGVFFALWARSNDWVLGAIVLGAIPLVFLFVLSLLVVAVLNLILRDFVAPLQVARGVGAQEAGGVFLSLLSRNPGLLFGYAILKLIFSIVFGLVIFIGSCLTCCVGFLPLVNQTLFQPIYFAERAWSLRLLAQLGEDVFGKVTPAPSTAPPLSEDEDGQAETINLARPDLDEPQG